MTTMKQRTDEEKIKMAPVVVTFGTTDYKIKPKSFNATEPWLAQLVETTCDITGLPSSTDTTDTAAFLKSFRQGLLQRLVQAPRKLAELILLWDPSLPVDLLDSASSEQIQVAFASIIDLACPLQADLGRLTELGKMNTPATSQRFLN
jgi:hypothetical protein